MVDHMEKIQNLVGNIQMEQLRYVDCFVGDAVALFVPVAGPCLYSITPSHTHPSYMFLLSFSDRTVIKLNNTIIISEPGKLFAIAPGIPHQEIIESTPSRYVAIVVSAIFFEQQLLEYPAAHKAFSPFGLYQPYPNLGSLIKAFITEITNKPPGMNTIIHALSLEITHSIIRSIMPITCKPGLAVARLDINTVIEYLYSNLGHKITISEMAEIIHMSPSHFSRIFKKETGETPIDYLNNIRLERAKKLLIAGEHSITEIALDCGFSSIAYLSASFYKKYKISPSNFQKNVMNK
jgi:AraC family transcriptional regulator